MKESLLFEIDFSHLACDMEKIFEMPVDSTSKAIIGAPYDLPPHSRVGPVLYASVDDNEMINGKLYF